MMQQQLSPHELAYQESLIHERESEIHEIESGIHELSEIFRDLGTLVNQQGDMLGVCYRCGFFLWDTHDLRKTTSSQIYPLLLLIRPVLRKS